MLNVWINSLNMKTSFNIYEKCLFNRLKFYSVKRRYEIYISMVDSGFKKEKYKLLQRVYGSFSQKIQ